MELANVLLVDGDLASRLTLKTLLQAGGYRVVGAAGGAEAIDKLDLDEYQLVLCDLRTESQDASQHVLAYARHKEYRPATALITSFMNMDRQAHRRELDQLVAVNTEELSDFLARVAELIGRRAFRRSSRALRQAS
jgi:CheY-like chemotaxis protein